MKKKLFICLVFLLPFVFAQGQSIKELYENKDFEKLTSYSDKTDSLTKHDLYCIGYAFFQLENDKKAIEMYDIAISKGLDADYIYLYKGLSLRYDKNFEEAIENFRMAILRNPDSQKNFTELANSFYFQEKYDSALVYFTKARALEFELGDPYIKLPHIYHVTKKFEKALEEYYRSASIIDKSAPTYFQILENIGLLEYTISKDYKKSIAAYSEVISLNSKNYDLYPKLIKAYYANEDFAKGDSLISILKKEFDKGGLSEKFTKFGNLSIAEFEWKNQQVVVYKYFKAPQNTLDIMYKVYLLNPDGKGIQRTLMTEQTIELGKGSPKHLLCEREKNGTHHTYSFGWPTDDIDYLSLKNAAIAVFDKELSPGASSNFGNKDASPEETPQKNKKKNKNKKKKTKK
jgi:tetratricopeptide (TPR) repeat protein